MKINSINGLNYKGITKYALDAYLKAHPEEEYSKEFLEFTKQQNQNKNFHIHYDYPGDGFFVAESNYFVENDQFDNTRTYRNFEKSVENLKLLFDDIYQAGEYADKLESEYTPTKSNYANLIDYVV